MGFLENGHDILKGHSTSFEDKLTGVHGRKQEWLGTSLACYKSGWGQGWPNSGRDLVPVLK